MAGARASALLVCHLQCVIVGSLSYTSSHTTPGCARDVWQRGGMPAEYCSRQGGCRHAPEWLTEAPKTMKGLAIQGKSGLLKAQFTPPSLLLIFMACSTGIFNRSTLKKDSLAP